MIEKLIEQQETIKGMQENEKSAIKIMKMYEDYKLRVDKAIEYIKVNCILSDEWTELDFCNFIPTGNITYKQLTPKKVKELLNILKGEDKE